MADEQNVPTGRSRQETAYGRWREELSEQSKVIADKIQKFEETRVMANADLNCDHFKVGDFLLKSVEVSDIVSTRQPDRTPDDTVEAEPSDEEKQEKAEKAKQHLQDLFMPALPSVDDVVAKTMKVCEDVGIEDPVERGAIFRTLAGRHNL